MLASVAYPLVWATFHNVDLAPYWAYHPAYVGVVSVIPLLIAVALARRAGAAATSTRSPEAPGAAPPA